MREVSRTMLRENRIDAGVSREDALSVVNEAYAATPF